MRPICACKPERRTEGGRTCSESGVVLRSRSWKVKHRLPKRAITLGSLEDQIADLTNSFNDLVGLPLPTDTELIEPR